MRGVYAKQLNVVLQAQKQKHKLAPALSRIESLDAESATSSGRDTPETAHHDLETSNHSKMSGTHAQISLFSALLPLFSGGGGVRTKNMKISRSTPPPPGPLGGRGVKVYPPPPLANDYWHTRKVC